MIAKLLKQKAAIEAQIAKAEQVEKNKNRVERLVLKLVHKRPDLFSVELTVLEKELDEAISSVAAKHKQ